MVGIVEKKLLLVTENLNVGFVAARFFNRRGFGVSTASALEEALTKFGAIDPDIVLIDDMGRGEMSLEILKKIRDQGDKGAIVPILMAGSIEWDSMIELEAKALGVHRFLFEPFDDFMALHDVLVETLLNPAGTRPVANPSPTAPPAAPTPSQQRYPTTPRPQRSRARVARTAKVEETPPGGGPSPSPSRIPREATPQPGPRGSSEARQEAATGASESEQEEAAPSARTPFFTERGILRYRRQSVEAGRSLALRSVAELFLCAHLDEWSGVLELEQDERQRKVFFARGGLVHLSSTDVADSLAGHLHKLGVIRSEQLSELEEEQRATGRSQAELLIQRGLISPHEVFERITEHVQALALDTLSWHRGSYRALRGVSAPGDAVPLRLDLFRLIFDGAKAHYGRERVSSIIANRDDWHLMLLPNPDVELARLKLTTSESRVFELAREGALQSEIAKGARCTVEEAYGLLYAFMLMTLVGLASEAVYRRAGPKKQTPSPRARRGAIEAGLNSQVGTSSAKKYSPAERELLDELDVLEKADYFEVLGIERDAENAEVQKAFRLRVKKFHPDKMARYIPEIKDKAAKVYRRIVSARQVLSDEQERSIYEATLDGVRDEAPSLPPDGPEGSEFGHPVTPAPMVPEKDESFGASISMHRSSDDPYARAEAAIQSGGAEEAVSILEAAKKEQGENVRLNAWLGWALFNVDPKNNRRDAERLLTRAHEANPHHPDPIILRARLAVRDEKYDLAFDLYFRAQQISPRDEALKKEVAIFEKRYSKAKPRKRDKARAQPSSDAKGGEEGGLLDKDVGDIFKSFFKKG